tara:strand:+ start:995 stop:1240 length:246 start_codon:yes stop_codon:yes gene_type:complete
MPMTAKIKLRDVDNLVISSTSITAEHYENGPDPNEFLNNAWKMADQMATHLSCSDEWRLTLTFDLDLRETIEDVMARQGRS